MRIWTASLVAACLLVAACNKFEPKYRSYADESTSVEIVKPPPPPPPPPPGDSSAPGSPRASALPMIAYAYTETLTLPRAAVPTLMQRHQAACALAGPTVCQVTASSQNSNRDYGDLMEAGDSVSGSLSLRATPAWIAKFRGDLGGEAKTLGGKITASEVTGEDLSLQIIDNEARLRAQTTLRDRLQALLANRPGSLTDLLNVERELARVQGEIDSGQSQLASLRLRIATSKLDLSYETKSKQSQPWTAFTDAVGDVFEILMKTLGVMVRFVAWTAPWLLAVGGLLWIFRKRLPKLNWRRNSTAKGDPKP